MDKVKVKRFFIFLLSLGVLFFQSCENKKYRNSALEDVSIVIDVDSTKIEPLKLNHILYVPLETSSECLIGHTSKVLIRDNRIYVADFDQAKALFVFDLSGKFIFKISKTGNGPNEYISFYDFDIQTNGDIYIHDNYGKKILVFNSVGEYLQTIRVNYFFSSFCLAKNKMYWSKLMENGKMIANPAVFDIDNQKTEFLFTSKSILSEFSVNFNAYSFYYSPGITYYAPKFSEIIYSINNEGVFPAIRIKNLHLPPQKVLEEWIKEENPQKLMKSIMESPYFIENVLIYETDDYISIGMTKGALINNLLYKKHSKSAVLISDYFEIIGSNRIMGSIGKEFFSVVDFNPENEYHKAILKSKKDLASWKNEDNPVIVFFSLNM